MKTAENGHVHAKVHASVHACANVHACFASAFIFRARKMNDCPRMLVPSTLRARHSVDTCVDNASPANPPFFGSVHSVHSSFSYKTKREIKEGWEWNVVKSATRGQAFGATP